MVFPNAYSYHVVCLSSVTISHLKVNRATTVEDLARALDTNPQWTESLNAAGWLNVLTIENEGLAMWQLMVHEIILKLKVALDQFCSGLKLLNFLGLIQSNIDTMRSYFVYGGSNWLMTVDILNLFKDITEHSETTEKASQFLFNAILKLGNTGLLPVVVLITVSFVLL